MAPLKSSLARSIAKLLGVSKDTDLSLRGDVQGNRNTIIPFEASGGNLANGLEPGNGYKYHTFGTNGDFVVTGNSGIVDILIVAGGGGGGMPRGAGGGAGGIVHHSQLSLAIGTHPVVVGDGGAATPTDGGLGNNGTDSYFGAAGSTRLTAKGGGGGGDNSTDPDGQGGGSDDVPQYEC